MDIFHQNVMFLNKCVQTVLLVLQFSVNFIFKKITVLWNVTACNVAEIE